MKQQSKKYITGLGALLFLLFSLCNPTPTCAQEAANAISFAKEHLKEGNFDIAIKVLNRVLFFDNGISHPEVFQLLAETTFNTGDYQSSRDYYDLASAQEENDSLRTEYTFRKVLCDLHTNDFNEAKIELMSFDGYLTTGQQWNLNLLSGITSFHLGEYNAALDYFKRCVDSSEFLSLENTFSDINRIEKRYRPGFARVMSIILPGSGQVYAGDYKNGFNSILLTGGLVMAGVALSASLSFIDTAIIVFPWFQRYYIGGYQRAFRITVEKQESEKKELLLTILSQLK